MKILLLLDVVVPSLSIHQRPQAQQRPQPNNAPSQDTKKKKQHSDGWAWAMLHHFTRPRLAHLPESGGRFNHTHTYVTTSKHIKQTNMTTEGNPGTPCPLPPPPLAPPTILQYAHPTDRSTGKISEIKRLGKKKLPRCTILPMNIPGKFREFSRIFFLIRTPAFCCNSSTQAKAPTPPPRCDWVEIIIYIIGTASIQNFGDSRTPPASTCSVEKSTAVSPPPPSTTIHPPQARPLQVTMSCLETPPLSPPPPGHPITLLGISRSLFLTTVVHHPSFFAIPLRAMYNTFWLLIWSRKKRKLTPTNPHVLLLPLQAFHESVQRRQLYIHRKSKIRKREKIGVLHVFRKRPPTNANTNGSPTPPETQTRH